MSPERFVKGESERTYAFLSLGAVLLETSVLRPTVREFRTDYIYPFPQVPRRWAQQGRVSLRQYRVVPFRRLAYVGAEIAPVKLPTGPARSRG
jgi:hypothetical protein